MPTTTKREQTRDRKKQKKQKYKNRAKVLQTTSERGRAHAANEDSGWVTLDPQKTQPSNNVGFPNAAVRGGPCVIEALPNNVRPEDQLNNLLHTDCRGGENDMLAGEVLEDGGRPRADFLPQVPEGRAAKEWREPICLESAAAKRARERLAENSTRRGPHVADSPENRSYCTRRDLGLD